MIAYSSALSFRNNNGEVRSHKRTVLSIPPLASVTPSGLNATLLTGAVCPVRVAMCAPVAIFQSRMVLSSPPLARINPSGLKATLHTIDVCPTNVFSCCPVIVSQSRIVWSQLPLASICPSGLNATLKTQFVCPTSVFNCTASSNIPQTDRVARIATR